VKESTAIILAAGRGKRLEEMSEEQPKPMTQIGSISLIENLISNLIEMGLKRIVIVSGYLYKVLHKHIKKFNTKTEIITIVNHDYDSTNNIYSLWLANQYLKEGFFLFEADIFFEKEIMHKLIVDSAENIMLVGKYSSDMDGTVVEIDKNGFVNNMLLKKEQTKNTNYRNKFKTVNFYKMGKSFSRNYFTTNLEEHIQSNDLNSYYELIIEEAINDGYKFKAVKTGDLKWWEIDTPQDYDKTKEIFNIK